MKIRDFLPLQGALRAGNWRIFEWSLLDLDDDDAKEPIGTAATAFGFAQEPVDELSPRLRAIGDDDDPGDRRFRRSAAR
jgi:hypothetical protein